MKRQNFFMKNFQFHKLLYRRKHSFVVRLAKWYLSLSHIHWLRFVRGFNRISFSTTEWKLSIHQCLISFWKWLETKVSMAFTKASYQICLRAFHKEAFISILMKYWRVFWLQISRYVYEHKEALLIVVFNL